MNNPGLDCLYPIPSFSLVQATIDVVDLKGAKFRRRKYMDKYDLDRLISKKSSDMSVAKRFDNLHEENKRSFKIMTESIDSLSSTMSSGIEDQRRTITAAIREMSEDNKPRFKELMIKQEGVRDQIYDNELLYLQRMGDLSNKLIIRMEDDSTEIVRTIQDEVKLNELLHAITIEQLNFNKETLSKDIQTLEESALVNKRDILIQLRNDRNNLNKLDVKMVSLIQEAKAKMDSKMEEVRIWQQNIVNWQQQVIAKIDAIRVYR